MATEIDAARLLVYKAAWAKDQGRLNNGLGVAKAKYFAGETVNKCANYAIPFWEHVGTLPSTL